MNLNEYFRKPRVESMNESLMPAHMWCMCVWSDFVKGMMWDIDMTPGQNRHIQHQLFVELTPEEERIVELLRKNGDMQINSIVLEASISVNKLITIMFSLEMKGVVKVLAGNVYKLL